MTEKIHTRTHECAYHFVFRTRRAARRRRHTCMYMKDRYKFSECFRRPKESIRILFVFYVHHHFP